VLFTITPLQIQNGMRYNVQTPTFTSKSGNPIQGASVTYYENCGCSGGYYHGTTNSNGQTVVKDVYPGAGTYTEWASITYQGTDLPVTKDYCDRSITFSCHDQIM